MPRFDGTGPTGQGPATGWGMGPCGAGLRRGQGGGFNRFSRGFGAGRGLNYRQRPWTKQETLNALTDEEKMLEEELQTIKQEIKSFKAQK